MGFFTSSAVSTIRALLKQDPSLGNLLRLKDALDEHNRNSANWSEEERKMAEEAVSFLNINKDVTS